MINISLNNKLDALNNAIQGDVLWIKDDLTFHNKGGRVWSALSAILKCVGININRHYKLHVVAKKIEMLCVNKHNELNKDELDIAIKLLNNLSIKYERTGYANNEDRTQFETYKRSIQQLFNERHPAAPVVVDHAAPPVIVAVNGRPPAPAAEPPAVVQPKPLRIVKRPKPEGEGGVPNEGGKVNPKLADTPLAQLGALHGEIAGARNNLKETNAAKKQPELPFKPEPVSKPLRKTGTDLTK